MTQKIAERYQQLAAALGDAEFKLHLMQREKDRLIAEIEELNKLAGLMKQSVPNEADQVHPQKA